MKKPEIKIRVEEISNQEQKKLIKMVSPHFNDKVSFSCVKKFIYIEFYNIDINKEIIEAVSNKMSELDLLLSGAFLYLVFCSDVFIYKDNKGYFFADGYEYERKVINDEILATNINFKISNKNHCILTTIIKSTEKIIPIDNNKKAYVKFYIADNLLNLIEKRRFIKEPYETFITKEFVKE